MSPSSHLYKVPGPLKGRWNQLLGGGNLQLTSRQKCWLFSFDNIFHSFTYLFFMWNEVVTCSECSLTAALRQLDDGRIGWNLMNSANITYCMYLESFSFSDILYISAFWVNVQNLCSALAACLREKLLKWSNTKMVPKQALGKSDQNTLSCKWKMECFQQFQEHALQSQPIEDL